VEEMKEGCDQDEGRRERGRKRQRDVGQGKNDGEDVR
jgi:hypothetical protein